MGTRAGLSSTAPQRAQRLTPAGVIDIGVFGQDDGGIYGHGTEICADAVHPPAAEHARVRSVKRSWRALWAGVGVAAAACAVALSLAVADSAVAVFKGYNANPAEFPWYVTLTHNADEWCGGTMIATNIVLTAAHCVPADHRTLRVVFGYHSRHSVTVIPGRVVVEDHFNDAQHLSDVAIVFIDRRPPSATPIDLVTTDPPLGAQLTAVGFGCSSPPGARTCTLPSRLQGIALQRADTDCGPLAATEFCVVSGRASLNHGDSGGPVMIKTSSRWQLAAVTTSLIINRGKVVTPYRAAVTSIAQERNWIASVLASSSPTTLSVTWSGFRGVTFDESLSAAAKKLHGKIESDEPRSDAKSIVYPAEEVAVNASLRWQSSDGVRFQDRWILAVVATVGELRYLPGVTLCAHNVDR